MRSRTSAPPAAAAVDGMAALGADSEHHDSEEIAEIVPAAAVGNGVDGDLVAEQRDDPGEREDEAVPQAKPEAGRAGRDRARRLARGAGGLEAGGERELHCARLRSMSASAWVG